MTEELQKPNPSPEQFAALQEEVLKLKANNAKLLDQNIKAKEAGKAIPPDVDVNALIAFKQKKEQEELEAKGRYDEAIAKQAQQFRDAEAAYKEKINQFEKRQRELEIETPAITALADVVHDPQYALSQINKEQLSKESDGTVVIVDGYNRTPVKEWAQQTLPSWVQKHPKPQGGGAPSARSTNNTEFVSNEKNPFAKESFNITEQMRLYRTDINKYNMLKNAVSG